MSNIGSTNEHILSFYSKSTTKGIRYGGGGVVYKMNEGEGGVGGGGVRWGRKASIWTTVIFLFTVPYPMLLAFYYNQIELNDCSAFTVNILQLNVIPQLPEREGNGEVGAWFGWVLPLCLPPLSLCLYDEQMWWAPSSAPLLILLRF